MKKFLGLLVVCLFASIDAAAPRLVMQRGSHAIRFMSKPSRSIGVVRKDEHQNNSQISKNFQVSAGSVSSLEKRVPRDYRSNDCGGYRTFDELCVKSSRSCTVAAASVALAISGGVYIYKTYSKDKGSPGVSE